MSSSHRGVGLLAYKREQSSRALHRQADALLFSNAGLRPATLKLRLASSELWTVELALDLAGWKPALLDGGTDAFL